MKSEQELNYLMGIIEGAMNNSIDPLKSFVKNPVPRAQGVEIKAQTVSVA